MDIRTLEGFCGARLKKAQDYEAAVKSRKEELKALAKAKKVISETQSGADSIAYGLSHTSFLQIRSGADLADFEAVRFIRELARKQKSTELAQLVIRTSSALQSGAADCSRKKDRRSPMPQRVFCDKELSEANVKKKVSKMVQA